jgi:WD40 repeat protein
MTVQTHSAVVWTVAAAPDGKTVATASGDGTVKVWDVASGKERATLRHAPHARGLAFSADGSKLASGGIDGSVILWDTGTWQERSLLLGHSDLVFAVGFAPDGRTLASASKDQTVKLWDVRTRLW